MNNQKGFGIIGLILVIFGALVLALAGAGAAAVLGKAPECANIGSAARSESQIGDTLNQGSVIITDGEATTLAQGYLGGKVNDARVCFTEGLGHISGKINLGSISPSFYISGGVDLTGSVPKATNLKIQLGSLPNIPALSSFASNALNSLISENLSKFELNQKYSASFVNGAVTISK